MTYRLTITDSIVFNIETGVYVPENGKGWDEYQLWIAAGNLPAPALSSEEQLFALQTALISAVQARIDAEARAHGYDTMLSLCTYATSSNRKFQAEGQAGVEWRDKCWALVYQLIDEVKAGTAQMPTEDELLAMMPAMVWPD